MIKEILGRILEGGMVDKKVVAREFGIQPETLEDIIRLLIDRGYLALEENGCEESASCASCESRRACQVMTEHRAFLVTERGERYARS